MQNKIILGFDPGKRGALTFMLPHLRYPVNVIDFAKLVNFEEELAQILVNQCDGFEAYAMVEKVHSMPSQGVVSVFTFGMYFGILKGLLAALGIPVEYVTPQKWKKHFDLIDPSLNSTEKKRAAKAKVCDMYPSLGKKNMGTYDSVLIAHYYREKLIEEDGE